MRSSIRDRRCTCAFGLAWVMLTFQLAAAEDPKLVPADSAEAARYWTNRLAPEFPEHTRLLAADSLELLALEAWEPEVLRTSLEGLASVIDDPDPELRRVRYTLSYGLRNPRLPSWANEIATNFYLVLLSSSEPGHQELGVEALYRSQVATQEVARMLDRWLVSEDAEVSGFAADLLQNRAWTNSVALRELGERLEHLVETGPRDRAVRLFRVLRHVADTLGDETLLATIPAVLTRLTQDPDPEVRLAAVRAIGEYSNRYPPDAVETELAGRVAEVLTPLLDDPEKEVALKAASELGDRARRSTNEVWMAAACRTFTRFLDDPSPSVRTQALDVLTASSWCWRPPPPPKSTQIPIGPGSSRVFSVGPWQLEPCLIAAWTNQFWHSDPMVRLWAMRVFCSSWAGGDTPPEFRQHLPHLTQTVLEGMGSAERALRREAWIMAVNRKFLAAGTVSTVSPVFRERLRGLDLETLNLVLTYSSSSTLSVLLGGPSSEGVEILLGLSTSLDPAIRLAVAKALLTLVTGSEVGPPGERDVLLGQLESVPDPTDPVPYEALPSRLAELAREPLPQLSLTAWGALVSLAQQTNWPAVAVESVDRLQAVLRSASSLERARFARTLQLGRLSRWNPFRWPHSRMASAWDISRVESLLALMLQDPNERTREEVVLALSTFGLLAPDDGLASLDAETRQLAADLRANRFRPSTGGIRPGLSDDQRVKALEDPEPAVRLAAALSLTEHPMARLRTNQVVAGRVYGLIVDTLKNPPPTAAEDPNRLVGKLVDLREILPDAEGLSDLAETVEDQFRVQGAAVEHETVRLLVALSQSTVPPEVARRMFPLAIVLAESGDAKTRAIVLPVLGSLAHRSWAFSGGSRRVPPEVAAQTKTAYRLLVEGLNDPATRVSAMEVLAGTGSSMRGGPPEAVLQSEALRQPALAAMRHWAAEVDGELTFDAALLLAYLSAEEGDGPGTASALDRMTAAMVPEGEIYRRGQPQRPEQISQVADALTQLAIGSAEVEVRRVAMERLVTFLEGLNLPASADERTRVPWASDDWNLAGNTAGRIESLLSRRSPASPEELEPLVVLIRNWAQSGDRYAAGHASRALSTMIRLGVATEDEDYLEGVLQSARSSDAAERKGAATALVRLLEGNPPGQDTARAAFEKRAGPVVLDLMKDADPGVRAAAYEVVNEGIRMRSADRLGLNATQWTEVIATGLRDEAEAVQVGAATALMRGYSAAAEIRNAPEWQRIAEEFVRFLGRVPDGEVSAFAYPNFRLEQVLRLVRDPADRENTTRVLAQRMEEASQPYAKRMLAQLLGELHMAWDSPAEAVGYFETALTLQPGETSVESQLARARMASGQMSETQGVEHLNQRERCAVLERLAEEGDTAKLLETANALLRLRRMGFGSGIFGRGEVGEYVDIVAADLARRQEDQSLERFLLEVDERYPNNLAVLDQLAQLRIRQGRMGEALELRTRQLVHGENERHSLESFRTLMNQQPLEVILARQAQVVAGDPLNQTIRTLFDLHANAGRTNEARRLIESVQERLDEESLTRDPFSRSERVYLQYELARLLEKLGDTNAAIAQLQKTIALDPEEDRRARGEADLARLYVVVGSTNAVEALVQTSPAAAAAALYEEARTHFSQKRVQEGLAAAQKLAALDWEPRELERDLRNLAGRLGQLGDPQLQQIVESVAKQLPGTPGLAPFYLVAAQSFLRRGDTAAALALVEPLRRIEAVEVEARLLLAGIHLGNGQPVDALEVLGDEPAGEDSSRSVKREYYELAFEAHLMSGDTNRLEMLIRQLDERGLEASQSDQFSICIQLGQWLTRLGRHSEAIAVLSRVKERAGGTFYALATAYERAGEVDHAIEIYEQGIAKSRRDPNLGLHLPLDLLGRLYLRCGRTNEALKAFREAQQPILDKIEKGSATAGDYNSAAWFYVERQVEAPEAVRLARKAVELKPNRQEYLDTLGWALLRDGQFKEALPRFAQAVKAGNQNSSWTGLYELTQTDVPATAFLEVIDELLPAFADQLQRTVQLHYYAALLHQHKGDSIRAGQAMASAGLLDERGWWFLGPFPNAEAKGYERADIPETATEIDRDASYAGRAGPVRWQQWGDGGVTGFVRLATVFNWANWASAYAWTTFESEAEVVAELRIGTEGAVKVWLNGELVLAEPNGREFAVDQLVTPVTLRSGTNSILVKSCNLGGACINCGGRWSFTVRLTRPGGGPLDGVHLLKEAQP